MAFSTFTKVGSLYRTTLKQGIASNATALEFNDTPLANIEYPNWFVIEPNSSNYEIIYCPTAPTGAAFTGVVRGINPETDVDTTDVAFQKGHAANVEVVLAPLHRQWNQLVDVMDGTTSTGDENFRVGKEVDEDITYYAQNADVNKPFLRYDASDDKWLISNDGVSTYDPSLGGSGLTAGLGIDITASAIKLDTRTSGGLRNNQGVGSKQADVDPTIVGRLDTANTWAAVQSITADNLQITTDANSANDAVRSSYLDATLDARISVAEATALTGGPTSLASDYHYHLPTQFSLNATRAGGGVYSTAGDMVTAGFQITSAPNDSDIYVLGKQQGASSSRYIDRYIRDATGNYYCNGENVNGGTGGSASASQYAAIACGATYVWTAMSNVGNTDIFINRYARDLSGSTLMTISGAAFAGTYRLCGNDSVLYALSTGSTTCAVYTISGTTATRGTNITLGDNGANVLGMYFDGTDIIYWTSTAIKRYNTSGVLQASRTFVMSQVGAFGAGLANRSTTDKYLMWIRPSPSAAAPVNALIEGYALDMP